MANIRQDFWFADMKKYVRFKFRMGIECLIVKLPRGKQPRLLHALSIGVGLFETVCISRLTIRDNDRAFMYVLVFVDSFTKFALFYTVARISAEETVQCVQRLVGTNGLPKRLVTDHGTCFTAHYFTYCEEQGTTHVLASSRHLQTNGQVVTLR